MPSDKPHNMGIHLLLVICNQLEKLSSSTTHRPRVKSKLTRCGMCGLTSRIHLSTLLVVTNTDGALTETVGPVTANLGADLRHALVRNEEPCAEDNLGHDIENSVGNDLSVNADPASTVGDTPNTAIALVKFC